ncbi:MerR family DNA-binding transcriptional regulator [Actinoplanes sp. NPDC051494]|uniref:MerR family DNA-binding transcriptional regulator n=1 Tax=Actinoplanes sp. NPDC051494 TaxID=3363907 RepID=UPI00379E6565
MTESFKPVDLAREHGLSAQAVRNYERDGFLPAAGRTANGYRVYTAVHAAALRAFLALIPAYGHAAAGRIMNALHDDDLDGALDLIDRGHQQLSRDRATLAAVHDARPGEAGPLSIGELTRRLGVNPATVRGWERAGILVPVRDPATGYRVFGPAGVHDAELTHLLRRGGYPLGRIAAVLGRIRAGGGREAVLDWHRRLTGRGVAMLRAAAALSAYLELFVPGGPDRVDLRAVADLPGADPRREQLHRG